MPSETPDDNHSRTNDQSNAKTAAADLACNGCRKAKLRCSRDRPSCLHCRKIGLECEYESKRIKPGLKAGAVENLHRRLDELERRIDEKHAASPLLQRGEHNYNNPPATDGNDRDSAALNVVSLLAKELPRLIDAASRHNPGATPPSSERSNKRRRLERDDIDSPLTVQLDDSPRLPDDHILHSIITSYFYHVHPWIPMIHQGRFLQRLSNEIEKEQFLVVLHSIILASSKYVPGACISSETRLRTRRWILHTTMDGLCLENLQALIILAFDDIGNGDAIKAWSIIGSLTRTVEYMQLAQEQGDGDNRPFCCPYASLKYTDDWTEIEERRRVFWNVFMLDRLCSVTMSWNTSLTSDDVYRKLPCDGHLWRKQKPVSTPYLGIWDKSKARIGNPIAYISRYSSPNQAGNDSELQNQSNPGAASTTTQTTDMSTVGALAYNIEATESMSRVMSYFLQQTVKVRDANEINSWLTRFKELDLRLVHWKMLLPQRWKANPNLTRPVPLMDPNLTTAHVTHNASMILLHQLIAYPPSHWRFRNRLPSGCSAEACYSAGVEIATITEQFLVKFPAGSPIGNQYAFCAFIAARVLLIHWRCDTGNQLASEFWSLLQSLQEMSRRWTAFSEKSQGEHDLFTKYATRLKHLYDLCVSNDTYQIDVMDFTSDINHPHGAPGPAQPYTSWSQGAHIGTDINLPFNNGPDPSDFTMIPQSMLDPNFVELDRVIAFNDGSMFMAGSDYSVPGW